MFKVALLAVVITVGSVLLITWVNGLMGLTYDEVSRDVIMLNGIMFGVYGVVMYMLGNKFAK